MKKVKQIVKQNTKSEREPRRIRTSNRLIKRLKRLMTGLFTK